MARYSEMCKVDKVNMRLKSDWPVADARSNWPPPPPAGMLRGPAGSREQWRAALQSAAPASFHSGAHRELRAARILAAKDRVAHPEHAFSFGAFPRRPSHRAPHLLDRISLDRRLTLCRSA